MKDIFDPRHMTADMLQTLHGPMEGQYIWPSHTIEPLLSSSRKFVVEVITIKVDLRTSRSSVFLQEYLAATSFTKSNDCIANRSVFARLCFGPGY